MSAQRAVRARPSKKQPAEWPAECTKRSLTQDEIAEFDGRVIDKCFPVLNEETGDTELVWYSGKIKYMRKAAMPFVFKITYDVDGQTENECYEGFRARDYYNFPDKAREPSQSPSRSKPLTDAQIREFNGRLVCKTFLTSETSALTYLGLVRYAPASAGVRERFTVTYSDAYSEDVYYSDLKELPYTYKAPAIAVLVDIARARAAMTAEKANSASDRNTPTFRALAAYATFTRAFADAAAAAVSAPRSPAVLELARRVADEARAYKARMPRGYLQQPTSSSEMLDAPSSNVSSITGAPPMPAVAPAPAPAVAPAPAPAVAPVLSPEAFNNGMVSLGFFGYKLNAGTRERRAALKSAINSTSRELVLQRLEHILKVNREYQQKLLTDHLYVSERSAQDASMESDSTSSAQDASMESAPGQSSPESESGEELEVERILGKFKNKYLVRWAGFRSSANWETVRKMNASVPDLVREFEEAQRPVAVKRSRSGAVEPVYREDMEFLALATEAKVVLGEADIDKLTLAIKNYHTTSGRINQYVFLLEIVLNYYTLNTQGYSHSVKWSNEVGTSKGFFEIEDDFGEFTNKNIFEYMKINPKNTTAIRTFRAKYGLSQDDEIHTRDYITDYRFGSVKPNLMPDKALDITNKIISESHKNIFEEVFLSGMDIQTIKYAPSPSAATVAAPAEAAAGPSRSRARPIVRAKIGGECMCYLCGKRIEGGTEPYTSYGEMDHIIPKTISFIMNVIDTPLNYAPTHGDCNNHKKENLPPFSNALINKKYVETIKNSLSAIETFVTLMNCDRKRLNLIGDMVKANRVIQAGLIELGFPENTCIKTLASAAPAPAPISGGAMRALQSASVLRRPMSRLVVAQPNPQPKPRPQQLYLSPTNVASSLTAILNSTLSKPTQTPRDVMVCMLLTDLIDFLRYISQPDGPQSGGAPGETIDAAYFAKFNKFVKLENGDPLVSVPERRSFILFRYRMMYRFSLATYYNTVALQQPAPQAEHVSRRLAAEHQKNYTDYIVNRIMGCVDYILTYEESDEHFKH